MKFRVHTQVMNIAGLYTANQFITSHNYMCILSWGRFPLVGILSDRLHFFINRATATEVCGEMGKLC